MMHKKHKDKHKKYFWKNMVMQNDSFYQYTVKFPNSGMYH